MDVEEAKSSEVDRHSALHSRPQFTDSMVSVSLSEPDRPVVQDAESPQARTLAAAVNDTQQLQPIENKRKESEEEQNIEPPKPIESSSGDSVILGQRCAHPSAASVARNTSLSSDLSRRNSGSSERSAQVDWNALDMTEEREKDEASDKATALLLARLDQENNRIVTDPKAGMRRSSVAQSRPPSLEQLKRLIKKNPEDVRFSLLPAPPMRELDFWLALTRDYTETAQRLPTLTISKIRSGIPPPLRGEVWKSIVGARDLDLEEQYEKLRGVTSPHEDRIDKDVGRTFPDHDFFNNPNLPGQRMLWSVLKAFSLYDAKIGYCQGLGFPVGTLLLQMGEKEAFCVFVRLMEKYDLTDCFAAPDLPGLQLRMYQYHRLLHRHLPELAKHLDDLQVNPVGYFPKWLLSLFAASCPQPLLVRIWDVMFAEGAVETVMRVGLAIMQRNQQSLMALSELDHVLPILLSRKMWDPYYPTKGDELVRDFVAHSSHVTREALVEIESDYMEAQNNGSIAEIAPPPEVQSAASRFLGRLWTSSSPSSKSASLSPSIIMPPVRRSSSLFGRASKQSYSSSVNSMGAPSESSNSLASTAPTELSFSRLSAGDDSSLKPQTSPFVTGLRIIVPKQESEEDKQIEELLLALSDAQRQNDLLETQLRKKEEERREDYRAIRQLIERLQSSNICSPSPRTPPDTKQNRRRTTVSGNFLDEPLSAQPSISLAEDMNELVEKTAARFVLTPRHSRSSSMFETKENLRSSLARTKDLLDAKTAQCNALSHELKDQQDQTRLANEALREVRQRLQESFSRTQQLEKTVNELRTQASRRPSMQSSESSPPPHNRSDAESTSGLRELKLSRSASNRSAKIASTPPRDSSLVTSRENKSQMSQDELLSELIATKTSEALAKNELAELQKKYDTLRRSTNALVAGGLPTSPTPAPTPTTGVVGSFWSWGRRAPSITSVAVGGGEGNDGK